MEYRRDLKKYFKSDVFINEIMLCPLSFFHCSFGKSIGTCQTTFGARFGFSTHLNLSEIFHKQLEIEDFLASHSLSLSCISDGMLARTLQEQEERFSSVAEELKERLSETESRNKGKW